MTLPLRNTAHHPVEGRFLRCSGDMCSFQVLSGGSACTGALVATGDIEHFESYIGVYLGPSDYELSEYARIARLPTLRKMDSIPLCGPTVKDGEFTFKRIKRRSRFDGSIVCDKQGVVHPRQDLEEIRRRIRGVHPHCEEYELAKHWYGTPRSG